jgi:hypothetical protein
MPKILIAICVMLISVTCRATEDTAVELEKLDKQVQALKGQELELTTELSRVEHQVYPEEARVNVFVSMQGGDAVSLESASVVIDGVLVGSHLYNDAEIRAISSGGIQKLYSGFIVSGHHVMDLKFIHRGADDQVAALEQSHEFEKSSRAVYVEAVLQHNQSHSPELELRTQ